MKGWMKKLAAAIAVTLSMFALTGCPDYESVELELISKSTMSVQSFDEETGTYTILVEGLAANTSGEFCTNARIQAYFYDDLGDRMDCYGAYYISAIDVDEVWHYAILVETQEMPASHEVSSHAYCY